MSTAVVIEKSGLAWPGAIFGDQEFNWRDSVFLFLGLAGYVAGMVPVALLMRKSRRH
jgi:hypothetical protein